MDHHLSMFDKGTSTGTLGKTFRDEMMNGRFVH